MKLHLLIFIETVTLLLLLLLSGWLHAATLPSDCISCHENSAVYGVHSGNLYGPTNRVADCADCHGGVKELMTHEDNGVDVINFGLSEEDIAIQNQTCLNCHQPESLRSAHWTHDAHGFDVSCADCHRLHPLHDPVRGLTEKSTIQLCVNCHDRDQAFGQGE